MEPDLSSIEARLSALELKEHENDAEIKKLRWENVNLKTVNLDLEKRCLNLEQKKSETSDSLKCLLDFASSLKDSDIANRLQKVEDQHQQLRYKHNKHSNKTKEKLASLEKEVTTLRGLQRLLSTLIVKNDEGDPETKLDCLEAMVKSVDDTLKNVDARLVCTDEQLKAVKNDVNVVNDKLKTISDEVGTMQDGTKAADRRVKDLAVDVLANKKERDDRNNSAFGAHFTSSQALMTGFWIEMDQYKIIHRPSPYIKSQDDVYECCLAGFHGIGFGLKQKGRGQLRCRILTGKNPISSMTLWTKGGDDECHSFIVFHIKKGIKLTIEVFRLEGEAEVDDCWLNVFFIC